MKQIDFLPERYRQAKKRRYTSYYRLGVTMIFIAAFAAAAGGLHLKQHDVRRQSEAVNKQYAAAQAQLSVLAIKQAELAKLGVYASVLTHLRHPWPRSRVLDDLTAPLPAEVALLRIELRSVPREMVRNGEAAALAAETGEPKAPNIETDLATLREQAESSDVVVDLEGTTSDQTSLHSYLRSLLASPLVQSAELTQVEAASGDGAAQSESSVRDDHFTAVVKLRPGWGLPGGPEAAPASGVTIDSKETAQSAPAGRSRS